jgi:hypothetical protein
MISPREWHTAALLPGGEVLVLGGEGSSAIVATAEVYEPVSGTWRSVSP